MIVRYNTVFNLTSALCSQLFHNFENGVDPVQLTPDETAGHNSYYFAHMQQ